MSASPLRATLHGRYVCVPNPCTTRPCLPGLAHAVQTDDACYLLTVAGRWLARERAWSGWTPAPGDEVTVVGAVSESRDLRGEPYRTIEVESLARRAPRS